MSEPVTVEFFGVPRLRAGRASLSVRAGTLRDVLAQVSAACPNLGGLLDEQGRVASHYLVSVNGDRFVREGDEDIAPGARVLLLTADVGG